MHGLSRAEEPRCAIEIAGGLRDSSERVDGERRVHPSAGASGELQDSRGSARSPVRPHRARAITVPRASSAWITPAHRRSRGRWSGPPRRGQWRADGRPGHRPRRRGGPAIGPGSKRSPMARKVATPDSRCVAASLEFAASRLQQAEKVVSDGDQPSARRWCAPAPGSLPGVSLSPPGRLPRTRRGRATPSTRRCRAGPRAADTVSDSRSGVPSERRDSPGTWPRTLSSKEQCTAGLALGPGASRARSSIHRRPSA